MKKVKIYAADSDDVFDQAGSQIISYIKAHYSGQKYDDHYYVAVDCRRDANIDLGENLDILDVDIRGNVEHIEWGLRCSKTNNSKRYWNPWWSSYVRYEYGDSVSIHVEAHRRLYICVHPDLADAELQKIASGFFEAIGSCISGYIKEEDPNLIQHAEESIGVIPSAPKQSRSKVKLPIKTVKPYLDDFANRLETLAYNRGYELTNLHKYKYDPSESTEDQAAYTMQFKAGGNIYEITDILYYDPDDDSIVPYGDMYDDTDPVMEFINGIAEDLGIEWPDEDY